MHGDVGALGMHNDVGRCFEVVDTSLLFTYESLPLKSMGLKHLMRTVLKEDIQADAVAGHSSVEDSEAALKLVHHEVKLMAAGMQRTNVFPVTAAPWGLSVQVTGLRREDAPLFKRVAEDGLARLPKHQPPHATTTTATNAANTSTSTSTSTNTPTSADAADTSAAGMFVNGSGSGGIGAGGETITASNLEAVDDVMYSKHAKDGTTPGFEMCFAPSTAGSNALTPVVCCV